MGMRVFSMCKYSCVKARKTSFVDSTVTAYRLEKVSVRAWEVRVSRFRE